MPVGTQGTVKGLTPLDLRALGAQCVLANTYHLWLRPGHGVIRHAGGLHAFMGWGGPILTDSGGFQELSLGQLCRIDERGAAFESHLDGEERLLTPELAMEIQAALGSDIAMALDICPPHGCAASELGDATERNARWAVRSVRAPHAPGQAVFGIVQGGTDVVLRSRSAGALGQLPFDGYGIGGLSIGEERGATWLALDASLAPLPPDKPRYLMGVGAPADLLTAVAHGVDLFDCVLPTRLGRNGTVLTDRGPLNLRNARFGLCTDPIDPSCDCLACASFSLGYLHYLVRSGEDLGLRLASLHNIRYVIRLLADVRRAIVEGCFLEFWSEVIHGCRGGCGHMPSPPPSPRGRGSHTSSPPPSTRGRGGSAR